MTARSIVLALFGVAALASVAYFNDQVIKNSYLADNYMPIALYGALFFFVLLIHPWLRRLNRKADLSAREIAVIFAAGLCAAHGVGRGLLHHFSVFQMMPHHLERTRPHWQGEPARIGAEHIADWDRLAAALRAADRFPPGHPARVLKERIPSEVFASAPRDPERQAALLAALNALIEDRGFSASVADAALPGNPPAHTRHLRQIAAEDLTDAQAAALNRGLLEAAFDGAIAPRQPGVLELVPPRMLAQPGRNPSAALDGYILGLGDPSAPLPLRAVPWFAWRGSTFFWLILLSALNLLCLGLALVFHRQWTTHERLPYPTAELARILLPESGGGLSAIFRRRSFRIGFAFVFLVHLVNYLHRWWPDYVIPIARAVDLTPFLELAPVFRRSDPTHLFRPEIYFTALGFAYFLASDVSLSLGLSPYLYALAAGIGAGWGYSFGGGRHEISLPTALHAGGYTALFLVALFLARRHLTSVFRGAVGLPAADPVEPSARWGARAAAAGFVGFVATLIRAGVDWPLAAIYTALLAAIFVAMSRLLAETGAFFMHPNFFPCTALWMWLGSAAFGPVPLTILGLVSMMTLNGARAAFMPLLSTGIHLADRAGAPPGRTAALGAAALGLAMAIAIPTALYWQYRGGVSVNADLWSVQRVPRLIPDRAATVLQELRAQGRLELRRDPPFRERLRAFAPRLNTAIAFAVAFGLVLLFTFLRYRFARWPLHPLIFVMLGSYYSRTLGFSFLLGWLIKTLVTKYGGERVYRRLKPLMFGLVAGEVVAAVTPLLAGLAYYGLTGRSPPPFGILPG